MPPLTITFVFPRFSFKSLLSKASFHFKNLFLCPSIVSLTRTMSSAYSNSLSTPSGTFCDNVYHNCKRKDDSTNLRCIPTLTSNSSEDSESTLTLVLTRMYMYTHTYKMEPQYSSFLSLNLIFRQKETTNVLNLAIFLKNRLWPDLPQLCGTLINTNNPP